MATKTFTYGADVRIEAAERAMLNGINGRFWVERRRCADGSGWMHWSKTFVRAGATRKDIVRKIGLIWRPECVNA